MSRRLQCTFEVGFASVICSDMPEFDPLRDLLEDVNVLLLRLEHELQQDAKADTTC